MKIKSEFLGSIWLCLSFVSMAYAGTEEPVAGANDMTWSQHSAYPKTTIGRQLEALSDVVIYSPNGELSASFLLDGESVSYEVFKNNECILEASPISIKINDEEYTPARYTGDAGVKQVKRTLTPEVRLKSAVVEEAYNENLLSFENGVSLRVRLYDDALAFRWETDRDNPELIVNEELFTLTLPRKICRAGCRSRM